MYMYTYRYGGDESCFYYTDICSQKWSDNWIIVLKYMYMYMYLWFEIYCITDLQYTCTCTSPFAVINYNRCLYKQHWSSYRSLKAKKAGNMEQDSYQLPFYCIFDFQVFGFCACANIKHVPRYKETYPDV